MSLYEKKCCHIISSIVISIVIPYIHSEAVWDELLFTVRSIYAYFKEEHEIILVGDKHPKLDLRTIECDIISGKPFSKCADSYNKMKLILESDMVTANFIYWYDDIVLLRPINYSFFSTQYYLNEMSVPHYQKNVYSQLKAETYVFLKGKQRCYYNFETHMPKLFSKKGMKIIMDECITKDSHLLLNSLYCNTFMQENIKKLSLGDDVKAGFYGISSPYGYNDNVDHEAILQSKTILNYDNKGLTANLKKCIISRFKTKCPYEK